MSYKYDMQTAIDNANTKGLALININNFWNINSIYGFDIGDIVLKELHQRLQNRFEKNIILHMYADFFAIINIQNSNDEFLNKLNALLFFLNNSNVKVSEHAISVQIRIGVAFGVENLLLSAEIAVRKAKNNAKHIFIIDSNKQNSICNFIESTKNALIWENKIKKAIKQDNFEVFAQKIVGGQKTKYECLIRLNDDNQIISPFFFLEHAKRANLYKKLTKIVIEKSFMYFANIDADFSINLSLEDIVDNDITDFLYENMYLYSVTDKLILELVESEHIKEFDFVSNFINNIKKQGVRIAIDDFGTGYSNFEYLTKLNIDFLKIDGSLISKIDKNSVNYAIVEAIVNFAKIVGIKTVAEFVSSQEIYEKCISLNIDFFQGYHFHQPTALNSL